MAPPERATPRRSGAGSVAAPALLLLLLPPPCSAGGASPGASGSGPGGGGEDTPYQRWGGELLGTFAELRRTVLREGERPLLEHLLETHEDYLNTLISKRCPRFFSRRFRHTRMMFTHVPKTGGQALQVVLYKEMERFGLEPSRRLLAGHLRYGDVKRWKRGWMSKRPDLMTVLRDPESLILSNWAYMHRKGGHASHTTAEKYNTLTEYLRHELDDGAGDGFALFYEGSRENRTLDHLRAQCTRARFKGGEYAKACAGVWQVFFQKVALLLASRYTIVGVLERMEDTLEVARCRVPWMRNVTQVPKRNARPDAAAGLTPGERKLLSRKTTHAMALYRIANRILDEDLKCCRTSRPPWMDKWWEKRREYLDSDRVALLQPPKRYRKPSQKPSSAGSKPSTSTSSSKSGRSQGSGALLKGTASRTPPSPPRPPSSYRARVPAPRSAGAGGGPRPALHGGPSPGRPPARREGDHGRSSAHQDNGKGSASHGNPTPSGRGKGSGASGHRSHDGAGQERHHRRSSEQ
eukprot:TRINITY_DN7790_c0_g2_i1.p1 TRINITY_DN7790_c0_g2~~TRINITY_DN7790_c0_g2_i1.p1  ORF type:complete len:522 (+),score=78.15 TRINITY_DN7790_c0_g2_i1:77-1642(+)